MMEGTYLPTNCEPAAIPKGAGEMTWPVHDGKNCDEFHAFVGTMIKHRPSEHTVVFRGQAVAGWSLKHSLARHLLPRHDEESAIHIEQESLKKFQEQAHLVLNPCALPERNDLPRWWAIMQHYNAPTRLLDWTKSPFVALYFALVDKPGEDGAVWQFDIGLLMKIMSKQFDHTTIDRSQFVEYSQSQSAPQHLFPLDVYRKSDRMVVQQGLFTVCQNILGDHGKIIDEALTGTANSHGIFVIPHEHKTRMLRQLESMNITASTLFPGIDGLGRSVSEFVRMEAQYEIGLLP